MRHRVAGRHLGRDTAHRRALYRNLVTDLLRYERITTTEAKAKEIRPMAEKIITLGRRGDLHSRRQALRFVYDPKVVAKVFDDIGPRMRDRPGGYLRITALEPRKGDGAKMAAIELVDYVEAPSAPRPERVTAAPAPAPAAPSEPEPAETEPAAEAETEATAETETEPTAEAPAEPATADESAPEAEDAEAKAPEASAEQAEGDDAGEGDEGNGDAEPER